MEEGATSLNGSPPGGQLKSDERVVWSGRKTTMVMAWHGEEWNGIVRCDGGPWRRSASRTRGDGGERGEAGREGGGSQGKRLKGKERGRPRH